VLRLRNAFLGINRGAQSLRSADFAAVGRQSWSLVAPNSRPRLDPVGRCATVAANELDVTPNVVHGRVNHTDLKLDVTTVTPKSEMLPTLIFHQWRRMGGQIEGSEYVEIAALFGSGYECYKPGIAHGVVGART